MRANSKRRRPSRPRRAQQRIAEQISERPEWRHAIMLACKEAGDPLSSQAIHGWKKLKRGVPADRVMIVSRIIGIAPYRIRPDVFPPP